MDTMFWIWIAVIVSTVIIEGITLDMVSIWFTAGAIIPFILSAFNVVSWEIQLAIFIVLSAVLIFTLRKVTKKLLFKNASKEKINTLAGIQTKMLSEATDDNMGQIKINDVIWSAKSENDEEIKKDELVEIIKISGNKAIVKKINNKEK